MALWLGLYAWFGVLVGLVWLLVLAVQGAVVGAMAASRAAARRWRRP